MKTERSSLEKPALVFVAGLPDTPGWLALSRKKQDQLLEHTSHIQQHRRLQTLGEFGELMELYQVQQLLEGEELKIHHYIRAIYSDRHRRTAERKHKAFKEFVEKIPNPVLQRLSSLGTEILDKFDRIANTQIGRIQSAIRELPQLAVSNDKDAEKYLEALDAKLLEHRKLVPKGKSIDQDEEQAKKMATNAVLHYMRKCRELKTSAQKRKFLQRVMGWVMDAHAVSGMIRAHRIPIPDGVRILRGRPKMTEEEKRKAREAREAKKKGPA